MSWFKIAADFIRDAMSTDDSTARPPVEVIPPTDLESLVAHMNRQRAEVDKNFEAVAHALSLQNAQLLRVVQIQKRWNYGLASALAILAIVVAIGYFRG